MELKTFLYIVLFGLIFWTIIDVLLTAKKYRNIKKSFENGQILLIGHNGVFEKISKKNDYKYLNINNEKYLTNNIKYFQIYNSKITIKVLDEIDD